MDTTMDSTQTILLKQCKNTDHDSDISLEYNKHIVKGDIYILSNVSQHDI